MSFLFYACHSLNTIGSVDPFHDSGKSVSKTWIQTHVTIKTWAINNPSQPCWLFGVITASSPSSLNKMEALENVLVKLIGSYETRKK